jgi:hypothetical protein
MAVIMQSWTSDHSEGINGIRIFGTEGTLVITDALYVNNEKADTGVEYASSFINQSKAFSDFILKDIPPISGLDEVEATLKITYGAYRSAENDIAVYL